MAGEKIWPKKITERIKRLRDKCQFFHLNGFRRIHKHAIFFTTHCVTSRFFVAGRQMTPPIHHWLYWWRHRIRSVLCGSRLGTDSSFFHPLFCYDFSKDKGCGISECSGKKLGPDLSISFGKQIFFLKICLTVLNLETIFLKSALKIEYK